MNKVLLLILLFFSFCNRKPIKSPDILSLKEMGELATVEYTVTKIIKTNDNKTWFKPGDRKILMSCEATIKAGVDLSSITKENFSIQDKKVQLRLPLPKVLSLSIPPDKIKVEYQEIGLFRDPFKTSERDALAAQAEASIRSSTEALGILEQAKANTSLFVGNLLKQMGYEDISITYGDSKFIKAGQ